MKKIICLILTALMLFSSVSAFASAYIPLYENMDSVFRFDVGDFAKEDVVIEEGVVTPAMQRMNLLYNLGIWDDAKKSELDLLTMTEFSIIMSKVKLGSVNALEGVYELNANDENVTYRQVYTYLLEALGYIDMVREYASSDEGLLIVANKIGLLGNDPKNVEEYITRGDFSELVAKALTIDLCIIEEIGNGGYRFSVADGKNLLNSVHSIYYFDGFVNGISGLSVFGGAEVKDGYIQIDRNNIKTGGLDLDAFLGNRVSAYCYFDEESDSYSVLYIDYAKDNQQIEIDFEDIVNIKNGSLTYKDAEENEFDVDILNLKYITENGKTLSDLSEMCDYTENDGKIVFTASEKNGDIDTALIYKYNYFVTAYADIINYRLGLNYGQTYNELDYIQLSDKDRLKITVDGAETAFEKLPANIPFRVMRCEETGYTEIVAVNKKIVGEVESMGDGIVTVKETEYTLTKDLIKHINYCKENPTIAAYKKVKELVLGVETTFYVFDDKIVCYTFAQEYKYGYLKSVSESRTGIDPDLTFRILTQDGDWDNFTVSDSIEVDGRKKVTKEALINKINASVALDENPIINNVIRFKANGKNELIALDTVEEDTQYENDEAGFTDDIKFAANHNFIRNWTGDWLSLASPYMLSTDTIIFVAPAGETNEDNFRVVKPSQLPGATENNPLPMQFFNPNDYNQISLALTTKSFDEIGSDDSTGEFFYVEGIRRTIIDAEEGEYGYRIMAKRLAPKDSMVHTERVGTIVADDFVVAEELYDRNFMLEGEDGYDYNKKIEIGDLIQANVIAGEATTWTMLLKGGVVGTLSEPDDEINDYRDTTTYEVFAKGEIISINPATRIVLFESEGKKHPAYMNVTAVIDTAKNKIRLVSAADFKPGDIMYTYVRYGRMYIMVKNE